MLKLSEHLYRCDDTCHVYALVEGDHAVLIDFGSGRVLEELAALGVARVTDVLLTHHHRDQAQGLRRAIELGACVWAPHAEQDLIARVDAHWQAREVFNNYNVRQDRFSLLEPVPLAGTLHDYEQRALGGFTLTVLPTPGHTTGSVSLLAEIDGQRVAFTGDLIAAPGKLWSLAATQWTYNGAEGAPATIASLLDLKERAVEVLLPSHGEPIRDLAPAIDLLVERLWRLLRARGQNPRLFELRERPYEIITPHLLQNRTSVANSYVLLSESGTALVIDFGYDFVTGIPAGADRASRRPWLYTLPALKRDFGVTRVEVAVPTHYHDDHVAGLNLLRAVEGTEVWAAEAFSDVLEQPARYDLPCLWYDPIRVDRALPLGQPIEWREYTFMLHPLPGHTRYAVAIEFGVDGKRVLATGDQYQGDDGLEWNYVYANDFQPGDYTASAALYRRLTPDLILSGHWAPLWVAGGYFDRLQERGELLERLHRELLPPEVAEFAAEGWRARLEPYQACVRASEALEVIAHMHNPFERTVVAIASLVIPEGWQVSPHEVALSLPPHTAQAVSFDVTPAADVAIRRARIALDLTLDARRLGQVAEALVDVETAAVSDQAKLGTTAAV